MSTIIILNNTLIIIIHNNNFRIFLFYIFCQPFQKQFHITTFKRCGGVYYYQYSTYLNKINALPINKYPIKKIINIIKEIIEIIIYGNNFLFLNIKTIGKILPNNANKKIITTLIIGLISIKNIKNKVEKTIEKNP